MSELSLPEALRKPGALDITQMELIADGYVIEDLLNNHHSNAAMYFQEPEVGLGLYRTRDHYLVGLQHAALHDHERWLFLRQIGTNTWQRLGEDAHTMQPSKDPVTKLASVRYLALGSQRLREGPPEDFASAYLAQWLFPSGSESAYMRQVLASTWRLPLTVEDRHDLFYHYDLWQTRNPDFHNMPQDLALRMHGLGGLLDAQALLMHPLGTLHTRTTR